MCCYFNIGQIYISIEVEYTELVSISVKFILQRWSSGALNTFSGWCFRQYENDHWGRSIEIQILGTFGSIINGVNMIDDNEVLYKGEWSLYNPKMQGYCVYYLGW